MTIGEHIYYLDDDREDVYFLAEAFAALHYHKLEAFHEGELLFLALEKDEKEQTLPCAIILDKNLHKHNGLDLLKTIRGKEAYKNVPVFVFSGALAPKEKKLCESYNATTFTKPINIHEWEQVADRIIRLCRQQHSA